MDDNEQRIAVIYIAQTPKSPITDLSFMPQNGVWFCKPILQRFTKEQRVKPESNTSRDVIRFACVCFGKPILQIFYKKQSIKLDRVTHRCNSHALRVRL